MKTQTTPQLPNGPKSQQTGQAQSCPAPFPASSLKMANGGQDQSSPAPSPASSLKAIVGGKGEEAGAVVNSGPPSPSTIIVIPGSGASTPSVVPTSPQVNEQFTIYGY